MLRHSFFVCIIKKAAVFANEYCGFRKFQKRKVADMENVWNFLVGRETKRTDRKTKETLLAAVILIGLTVGEISGIFTGETQDVLCRLSESPLPVISDASAEMQKTEVPEEMTETLTMETRDVSAEMSIEEGENISKPISENPGQVISEFAAGGESPTVPGILTGGEEPAVTEEQISGAEPIISEGQTDGAEPIISQEQAEEPPAIDEITADDTRQTEETEQNPDEGLEEPAHSSAFEIDESGMICAFYEEFADVGNGILRLPEQGCKGVRRGAFAGCTAEVYELHIPSNITVIENGAFAGLELLEWMETETENPSYVCRDGVLFDRECTVLLSFPCGRIGGYLVPGSVERIAEDAFYHTSISILDVRECANIDKADLEKLRAMGITVFE